MPCFSAAKELPIPSLHHEERLARSFAGLAVNTLRLPRHTADPSGPDQQGCHCSEMSATLWPHMICQK